MHASAFSRIAKLLLALLYDIDITNDCSLELYYNFALAAITYVDNTEPAYSDAYPAHYLSWVDFRTKLSIRWMFYFEYYKHGDTLPHSREYYRPAQRDIRLLRAYLKEAAGIKKTRSKERHDKAAEKRRAHYEKIGRPIQ